MGFLANLTIGKRLAIGFALILAFTVVIAGAGIWRLQHVAADTRAMMTQSLAKERLIADWYTFVFGAVRRTAAIAKSSDPALGLVAVVQSSATPTLRARRHELIGSFADLVAHEAAVLYGEDAWPADRARIQGLVYVAGFAELVASWLTGEVDLSAEQLADTASDLFVSLSRRP